MFIIKHVLGKIIGSSIATIQIILIILRLLNVITWPWHQVFMPLIAVAVVSILFSILIIMLKGLFRRRSS
ncbi:MAG: hypothetical protein HFG91_07645 [Acholeplasmatales bacterium]|nr:hypothetical protein [Acholeplasmatales bacterium]